MTVTVGVDVYADLAEADAYFATRLVGDWAAASVGEREAALLRATAFLDGRYRWIGHRAEAEQLLGWPRLNAVDFEGRTHRGIPVSVKHACAELAWVALGQDLAPQADRGGRVVAERVGTVELRYADDAPVGRAYPFIDLLLTGLVRGESSVEVRRT